ncbi:MAG: exopolysaccharide biosynthesis polyprenyl glycosylphosphotransferase [Pseudomonadota bacterium]
MTKVLDRSPSETAARGAVSRLAPVGAVADGAVRGPFRPQAWLNARQRQAARLAPHAFRLADVVVVSLLTAACAVVAPGALAAAPVASVAPLAVGAIAMLGLMRMAGLYSFPSDRGPLAHVASSGVIAAIAAGIVWLAGRLLGEAPVMTTVWISVTPLTVVMLHALWSLMIHRWRASGVLKPNVVLVGATRHAEGLIRLALQRRDINVLGVFDDRLARTPEALVGVPVLGRAADLLTHPMAPYVDRIVVAIDPKAQARVRELGAQLAALPNEVTLLVDPEGPGEQSAALDRLARTSLSPLDGPVDHDRRAFEKRLQDLIVGSLALIALAPVMALTALAIRLDGPGPIFFRQRRHGFNQEEIVVWKFRTMRPEAADATASRQVVADDDRVTRVGRILRSTSLDELPQLLNVLAGEMSLVGPRPHAIGMKTGRVESAQLVADYAHRHRIKPGMTGWAAIKGSRGPMHDAAAVRRRVSLDIEYIERQSTWLDLWIMLVTVPVLLGDRQAVR